MRKHLAWKRHRDVASRGYFRLYLNFCSSNALHVKLERGDARWRCDLPGTNESDNSNCGKRFWLPLFYWGEIDTAIDDIATAFWRYLLYIQSTATRQAQFWNLVMAHQLGHLFHNHSKISEMFFLTQEVVAYIIQENQADIKNQLLERDKNIIHQEASPGTPKYFHGAL